MARKSYFLLRKKPLWLIIFAGFLLLVFLWACGFLPFLRKDQTRAQAPHLQIVSANPKFEQKPGSISCFVAGKLINLASVEDCAKRNGTTNAALDTGIPQPPPALAINANTEIEAETAAKDTDFASCSSYGTGGWKDIASHVTLNVCVHKLFQGHCVDKPELTLYGRYGQQTLRLVPGKLEISDDGRQFHLLMEQSADCLIPAL